MNALRGLLAALLLALPCAALADMTVGSWNVTHLGWNTGKDLSAVARIASAFDLLAIQEVMDDDAMPELVRALSRLTGEPWEYMASHSIGRGSYKELYSFVWRKSAVEYVDGAVVFLDHRDVFAREPFSARFRDTETGQQVAVASVHVLYGDSVDDRLPEIAALADYWQWMAQEVYGDTPRLLVGDFNLPADHPAWLPLRQHGAEPALNDTLTTLSPHNGRYASAYDNLWYTPGRLDVRGAGMVRFPEVLDMTHEQARETVSDHAPVYVQIGSASPLPIATPAAYVTPGTPATNEADDCVDLNRSSAISLDALPHIGPARAKAIIQGRPWGHVEQLSRISGLGSARVGDIIDSGLLCSG